MAEPIKLFPDAPPCRYRATAKAGRAQIDVYGVIGGDFFGDGITSKMVSDDLKRMGSISHIDVFVNSPGGDVFEGRGIYNLLANHSAKKTVHVIAEAASAASLIAMAGDEIRMASGALMMIHRARAFAFGTVTDMRKMSDLLETVDGTLLDTYEQRTKQPRKKLSAMLDNETWMTAEQAVEFGFADAVDGKVRAAAMAIDRTILGYQNIPAALLPKARVAAAMEQIRALGAT